METNCKQFKKNKDPKCNDQTDCEWVKKRGCLTKEDARALQNTKPTDTQPTDTQPTEEQKSEIIHIQHKETADEAVENYYKLKKKYHNQYLKQKNKILKTDKTNKQKALELKKIKLKCVNCKQLGGTIFSSKNGVLSAICGVDNKCNLNIIIEKGSFIQKDEIINMFDNEILNLKEKIIITKLNVLFRLKTEEEMLKEFKELKEEYNQRNEVLGKIKQEFNSAEKKVLLLQQTKLLNEELKEFKNLIKESQELEKTKNITHAKAVFHDAMEKYVNDILRLQINIRNLNNEYIYVESSLETPIQILNEINLVKEKYLLKNTEIELEPVTIKFNKYKK
jgi:hypothetical protein